MNQEITIIGYHGTTIENATNILNNNFYNKSTNIDDWLGEGIYFYDVLDNAILYNIRQYINETKSYPNYDDLKQNKCILVNKIVCNSDEIVDLNTFKDLQKFLGLWKMFYDKVKNVKTFKNLKFKDGYMINWLCDNTPYFNGCKIFKNVFQLDLKFKRNISNIFKEKTRIGYTLAQIFLCVVDASCIHSIELYQDDYENEYNVIKDFTNNILMEGGNDEIS